tara:strand:- start:3277 stop:4557 length:1281 start_codon:yes stop_codon:yes gene_type:complete
MKKYERKIYVIGLNSFKFKDLSLDVQDLFFKTINITAPTTFANEIKSWLSSKELVDNKNFYESKSNDKLIEWLSSTKEDVILFSRGDPLWFGIGRILLKNFTQKELTFYPANTSVQLAFSKLKISWQDTKIVSVHGRDSCELIKCLKGKQKKIAILTDPKNKSLELIRENIKELNLEKYYDFWLCEEIGYEKEKITLIESKKNLPIKISDLHIVILLKKENINQNLSLPLFGIGDSYFDTFDDRPNLITKREIRIQLLADLELPEFGTLIDIGSGSGTIGLEALRIRPNLNLICIDKRLGSRSLTTANARRLEVLPKKIIEGEVKAFLNHELRDSLTDSNRIIIGGCDKETKILVINYLNKYLNRGDIIILPIITYEILGQINLILRELNYETSLNLIQTFKGVSIVEGTRFEPNNPVFIIKAKKK